MFKENFVEIDNNSDDEGNDKFVKQEIIKKINLLLKKEIKNPIALKWIQKEKEIKNKLK